MNKENKNQEKFIKTQDLKTYESLLEIGFKLIDCTNGTWTFINNPDCPLTFDNNKVTYSNMLCF